MLDFTQSYLFDPEPWAFATDLPKMDTAGLETAHKFAGRLKVWRSNERGGDHLIAESLKSRAQ
jgi:hypothetical protein